MPGPVSDSYDPEFGTGATAQEVKDALLGVRSGITKILGPDLKNIVEVVRGTDDAPMPVETSRRELRLIRFALDRAMESI